MPHAPWRVKSVEQQSLRTSPHRVESTCCVIHGIYSETRVYTPGSRGLPHPTPDETTPTTIMLPAGRLPTIKGPPLSVWKRPLDVQLFQRGLMRFYTVRILSRTSRILPNKVLLFHKLQQTRIVTTITGRQRSKFKSQDKKGIPTTALIGILRRAMMILRHRRTGNYIIRSLVTSDWTRDV